LSDGRPVLRVDAPGPPSVLENQRVVELADLGVLTASLLHELRQPLFAVKGRLQLAMHGGRDLGRDELDILLHHVAHIEELVEHYAGLGRSDDSWLELDLREEVSRSLAILAHRVRQVGATLESELGDVPLMIRGRSVAVRQVVMNLVGNALDAVTNRDLRRITVVARRRDLGVVLVVTDTGAGIPEEVRDHLFEPFVTTKIRGTGLGLYIARKLAEEAGGRLRAEHPPDGGTRMVVELP
jgi:two-component system C4-dicarboxylate transport sensor histidine kinase DctB